MADNAVDYDIIFKRRHPKLAERDGVWRLIYNSYLGGLDYYNNSYLFQYPKESDNSFSKRKQRAVYFNQIQPLADLLSGFLFMKPPSRKNTLPADWLIKKADNKKKPIDEFMKVVATYSLMFTCGVLVDSPSFDPKDYPTMKDRQVQDLNPYCVFYLPFQIVDFNIADDGLPDWVLLDNTCYDNPNPFAEGRYVQIRRLWTRESYQDFELVESENGKDRVIASPAVPHSIGYVPFRFINWKDDNSDFIEESVFEDPAMISKLIYNKLSEMDEMIAAGSFKVLMYPTNDGTIPTSMTAGGIGALSAIPYDGRFKPPHFDGAALEDVGPFLKAIEFYLSEILKKIGMNTDETKDYVKSGLSKKIDFQKVRTLLISGSIALASLEEWIFETAVKWTGKDIDVEVHYTTHYADEDIQAKNDLLNELLIHPFKKLKKSVISLQVKNILTGEIPQSELEEIYKEIQTEADKVLTIDQPVELDIKKLAGEEQASVNKKQEKK
jgi:hypothetical protein